MKGMSGNKNFCEKTNKHWEFFNDIILPTHVSTIPNLFSAEAAADPYPIYNELREQGPVVWYEPMSMWMVTRYQDVSTLLRSPDFLSHTTFRRDHLRPETQFKMKQVDASLSDWIVFLDGPDHARLRRWLNKAFTPAAISSLAFRIDAVVARLLDDVKDQDSFDLVRALAYPLPAAVIGMILGIPPEDVSLVKKWSSALSAFFSSGYPNDEQAIAGQVAYSEMAEYVSRIARARKADPQDDLISAMVHAEPGGSPLTEQELLSNCCLFLFAGHETTTRLIADGIFALLRHPTQFNLMKSNPGLVSSGIESSCVTILRRCWRPARCPAPWNCMACRWRKAPGSPW